MGILRKSGVTRAIVLVGILLLQLGSAQSLEYEAPEEQIVLESREAERELPEVSRAGDRSYKLQLEISAYNPSDPKQTKSNWDGLAFDGRPAVPYHTISVDPRVIELGSKVYVPGLGWFLAHDTGSYIKGYTGDVALGTNKECYAFGRQELECIVVPPTEKYRMAW